MNAFSDNTILAVTDTRNIDDFVACESCEPVFKTATVFNQGVPEIYIYQLKLKAVITQNGIYESRPCIYISLFKDADKANAYYKNALNESEKFKKHLQYACLAEKVYPAIQRFEKYMNTH